jgi:hypothetical protein
MITQESAIDALEADDVARGITWAFQSACDQALEDFARGTGYTALSAGVGRYDLLADRLDRVFSCGDYEVPEGMESVGLDVLYEGLPQQVRLTMPIIKAGTVIRSNLRGSNGWRVSGFRFITHSYPLGEAAQIDWAQSSKTLQSVSRQPPSTFVPITLLDLLLDQEQREDLAAQDAVPAVEMSTLVLVHALDRNTSDRELAIGHSRYNEGSVGPWHWREDLLRAPEPELNSRSVSSVVKPSIDAPDVTVRLRTTGAAEKTN